MEEDPGTRQKYWTCQAAIVVSGQQPMVSETGGMLMMSGPNGQAQTGRPHGRFSRDHCKRLCGSSLLNH